MKLVGHKASKLTKPNFFGKFMSSQNGPKLGFFRILWKFCHYFILETIWNVGFYNFLFSCSNLIWENSGSQVIGQNALVQSDCIIFLSSISLEGVTWYLGFFAWRKSLEKPNNWDYYLWVCLGRLSHIEIRLDLLGIWPG